MFNNKEDSRIKSTKEFIYLALIELLKTNAYDSIKISHIITKSGVSRASFYRHFYSKEDILLSELKQETIEVIQSINQLFNFDHDLNNYVNINFIVKQFLLYWDQHPKIIQLLIHLHKEALIYEVWTNLVIELFSNASIPLEPGISEEYISQFAVGGLTSLVIQWFKTERVDSIDYVSQHFMIRNKLD